jgi:hypothetical protein
LTVGPQKYGRYPDVYYGRYPSGGYGVYGVYGGYYGPTKPPTTPKPFGTEDATVASTRNGGKGFANSQASKLANQNPFVGFNAQGTGNGFGFGK